MSVPLRCNTLAHAEAKCSSWTPNRGCHSCSFDHSFLNRFTSIDSCYLVYDLTAQQVIRMTGCKSCAQSECQRQFAHYPVPPFPCLVSCQPQSCNECVLRYATSVAKKVLDLDLSLKSRVVDNPFIDWVFDSLLPCTMCHMIVAAVKDLPIEPASNRKSGVTSKLSSMLAFPYAAVLSTSASRTTRMAMPGT